MAGELHRGSTMRGVIGGQTEGTITAGGFAYDEATLTGLITEWLDLADDYSHSYRVTRRLVLVEGPGLDYASDGVAKAANSYGAAYRTYLRTNRDYCLNQAQLCQNALDDYLGIERRNVIEISKPQQPVDDDSDQGI